MATTRYFKATDGKRTFFRASPTRVYRSATLFTDYRDFQLHQDGRGKLPVTEITRQEYVALTALKLERAKVEMAALEAKQGKPYWGGVGRFLTAPSDSWVYNTALPSTPVEG